MPGPRSLLFHHQGSVQPPLWLPTGRLSGGHRRLPKEEEEEEELRYAGVPPQSARGGSSVVEGGQGRSKVNVLCTSIDCSTAVLLTSEYNTNPNPSEHGGPGQEHHE